MKLRSGAVDYGRIYEQKTAALFSIRCALDPVVTDFWIVSNVDDFGAFDDVVILVETSDGSKKVYCVQLKHIENRSLQLSQLEASSGNFSLQKYHDSYRSIKKNISKIGVLKEVDVSQIYFVLYTNAPLAREDKSTSIKLTSAGCFDFLSTTSKPNSFYQVSMKEDPETHFEQDFLQRFFIYTNQATATALDKLIKNEFDSHFEDISNTVIVTITDYFLKWSIGKKSKIKRIFKKDVQMKLLEYLLQPHVLEPKWKVTKEDIILGLLNDTLTSFNVTPIMQRNSLQNIFASASFALQNICDIQLDDDLSWNTNLTEVQHSILKIKNKQKKEELNNVLREKHHFVAHLTVRDLYFSAWECRIVPLIIRCDLYHNSVQDILVKFEPVTRHRSFVLAYPKDLSNLRNSLKVFHNFNDIDDTILMNRNLENTYISLQGKNPLRLKEFKQNRGVLQEITPDVYMILSDGILQIGEHYEIENYYIKRSLQRPHLSLKVLEETNVLKERENHSGDMFLLVAFSNREYIPYQYRGSMLDLASYMKSIISGKVDETKYIITTDVQESHEVIMKVVPLMQAQTHKAVHVIKYRGESLEWLFSKGPISILHDYLEEYASLKEDYINEDVMLDHLKSDINIISNNAGMGKTFMLTSLANKFDPDKWVCLIKLSEHMPKISQIDATDPTSYINYIKDHEVSMNDEAVQKFCTQIFRDRWNSSNTVWLLDGYDEVSSDDTLSFLKQVRQIQNVKLWITTRPTYTRDLEMLMDTLSLQITHFEEGDHVEFLWKYFETFNHVYGYKKEEIQYIIKTINKCSSTLDKTFIAIPLQTRMFAEIFGDDINQITDKERLTIVDFYNKFVDIKLKEYKSYEATSLKKTLSKLALKLFFTEDQLEELLDFEELREEALTFQESYKKDSIVIGLNERGDAVFGHRTFAEFMAAYWLSKQIVTKKGRCNLEWRSLVEKLFYVDMISVRVFFDKIICQNLPLHLAVLNGDVDSIQKLLNEGTDTSRLDILGRSALHLAVSYGNYYDLYVSGEIKGIRAVGLHTVIQKSDSGWNLDVPIVKTQLQIPTEIVEKMLDHGYLNVPDALFNYDAFDYAIKSCSLEALNCLFKRFDKDGLLFEPELNFKVFLYCIVYDNLHHILSSRKSYSFKAKGRVQNQLRKFFAGYNSRLLGVMYNDFYLTEIAALRGGKETLFELLQTGKLHVDDGYPVHKACYNGHGDIVDLLFRMGADVTKAEAVGWSPIQQAGKRGRSDITYQFLKDDKHRKVMQNNITEMKPIHYASQGGHLECIKRLAEFGAANPLEKDALGNTPLYYASLYGYIDVAVFMIKSLQANEIDETVNSALTIASAKGYSVAKLIEAGLNVDTVDKNGDTALVLASKNGFPTVIEELAQYHCDLNLMKTNENQKSLLKWAQLHHVDFAIKLLNLNLNRNVISGGLSALHFSILEGHAGCVRKLIDLGADRNLKDTIGLGYSPMIWAGIKGNSEVVDVLLSTNPDPTCEEKEDAEIALIWASILGFDSCVSILIKYVGTSDDPKSIRFQERLEQILKSEYGLDYVIRQFGEVKNIPLVMAAINNRVSVIKVLVSEKYIYNENDLNIGLFWASKKGHLEIVKTLIESGANENAKNERGLKVFPIVWASMSGHTKLVEFFLRNKNEVYGKNEDVAIALNFASTNGHLECMKVLLDFGLDIDHVYEDLTGGTPLLNACEYNGNPATINELLSRNCDIHARNSSGLTALDFLAKKKNFDLVKRLLIMGAHQHGQVDKESNLYRDLQEALDWAVVRGENEMVYRLVELGINKRS